MVYIDMYLCSKPLTLLYFALASISCVSVCTCVLVPSTYCGHQWWHHCHAWIRACGLHLVTSMVQLVQHGSNSQNDRADGDTQVEGHPSNERASIVYEACMSRTSRTILRFGQKRCRYFAIVPKRCTPSMSAAAAAPCLFSCASDRRAGQSMNAAFHRPPFIERAHEEPAFAPPYGMSADLH